MIQNRGPKIHEIANHLEVKEDSQYELRNELVYKKQGNKLSFLVHEKMEEHVLFRYHNEMSHVVNKIVNKMTEIIWRTYCALISADL